MALFSGGKDLRIYRIGRFSVKVGLGVLWVLSPLPPNFPGPIHEALISLWLPHKKKHWLRPCIWGPLKRKNIHLTVCQVKSLRPSADTPPDI